MSAESEVSKEVLLRRLQRERSARREAEAILEKKSHDLWEANQALIFRAEELDHQRRSAVELSRTDALTGVLNRKGFSDELRDALGGLRGQGLHVALAFVDLDRFKSVNDNFGFNIADSVLLMIAKRLSCVGAVRHVGRLGGDEFGLLLVADCPFDFDAIGAAVLREIRQPIELDGVSLRIEASIGFAAARGAAGEEAHLHRDASAALMQAKRTGRHRWVLFEESLRKRLDARRAMEVDLRKALGSKQIRAWFQPIVEVARQRTTSLEVLARWQDANAAFVSPADFIPLAEDIGVIRQLDDQVFHAACTSARPWVERGEVDAISINVSPRDIMEPTFAANVRARLNRVGLPAKAFVIELTETTLFSNYATAQVRMAELSALGLRFALDDFGTGYSNLRALAALPLDYVKLDRSLITGIESDASARTLANAAIQMAKAFGHDVVAEGVETPVQAELLRAFGCKRMQGYLFGAAMPEAAITEHLSPQTLAKAALA